MKTILQVIAFTFLLSFVFWSCPLYSQQVVFNKLLPPRGELLGWISDITQDQDGNMWFTTNAGLCKYNGYEVSIFKNDPKNPNSIIDNRQESIYTDSDGKLWIGSFGKGLDWLNPDTGIFTHFQHDPNNPESLINDTVTCILRDKQGVLWIGTFDGLDRFDSKTNKFTHFLFDAKDSTSISNNLIRTLFEDSQGTLWIGTGSPFQVDGGTPEDGGLNRLNKVAGTFTRYLHDPDNSNSLISNKVSAIFEDNQGILWIGTSLNGLHKLNRQNGTIERLIYDPEHPEKLSSFPLNNPIQKNEHITFITQDAAGNYWFGTHLTGLYYYNSETGKITHFQGQENVSSGFTENGAFRAYTSRDGILWIGTQGGNIYRIDPLQKKIQHTSLFGNPVNCFYEEPDGTFWFGTNDALFRKDKDGKNIKRFLINSNPAIQNENKANVIYGDREGNIWVGTGEGLSLWDKQNEKFISYKYDPQKNRSLSHKVVYTIYEDIEKRLWIGTANGLNLFDRKTGLFTRFYINPSDSASGKPNVFLHITEDKTGKLWIASWTGGINLFDRESKKFKNYMNGTTIWRVFEDTDGVLWTMGSGGLFKYNRSADEFIACSVPGIGSAFNTAISIVEDNRKNLWIDFQDGIYKVNPERNETRFYGQQYGVSDLLVALGACYKGRNGDIYIANSSGYYSFSPDELDQEVKAPEIVFTGFNLSGLRVIPGDGGPVKQRLSEQKEIRLKHNQNVFSIEFAAIDYANPEQNQTSYFLENYDETWRQSNSERKAYYFNIPPGKYVFHVRAIGGRGVWAEKKIDLIIMPPWWGTWWAYCIYGLVFIVLVYSLFQFQRIRLLKAEKDRNRALELLHAKEIEKAYTELEKAHETLKSTQSQLIQSEKMASLGELTAGIAHEIQNPLNFVNNFSEVNTELIEEMKDEIEKGNLEEVKALANDIADNEQKINHHGKRADAIVKGMLQHSRTSSGVKEPTNINALADEYLRLAYHGLRAKDKSFNATMKTDFDPGIGNINVIPQDIGRVILNLITNAFYAVNEKKHQATPPPEGGIENPQNQYEPTVTVSTKLIIPPAGGMRGALISVRDNGNGIPQKVLDKIFQPFFTTKPAGQGTGLGLSLSYDIVKAHGGEIKVESVEDKGTEFIVEIPLTT